jgi:hypothetical protein
MWVVMVMVRFTGVSRIATGRSWGRIRELWDLGPMVMMMVVVMMRVIIRFPIQTALGGMTICRRYPP